MLQIKPSEDKTILQCIRELGIQLESPCNGKGICGKCKIRIKNGEVNKITKEEIDFLSKNEVENNIRLACLTIPKTLVEIELLNTSIEKDSKVLNSDCILEIKNSPEIEVEEIFVKSTSLEKQESLEEKIGKICSIQALKKLPIFQNKNVFIVKRNEKVIDIRKDNKVYGVAVDIGTTTVAVSIMNLINGKVETSDGFINPQKTFGLDVLSRIHYGTENKNGVYEMQNIFIKKLQHSIEKLAYDVKINTESIYEIVLSGNSTMIHIVLGLPLNTLGKSPYSSIFNRSISVSGNDLGIKINDEGKIYCTPSVSTYIGGDIVSGVLASRIYDSEKTILFIDIGTNGEIVLSYNGKMYSCSCAAGPALEGMNISCGMRAEKGAIDRIEINNDTVKINVIGGCKPKGICGSGILEGISKCIKKGVIAKSGRILTDNNIVEIDLKGKRKICIDYENNIYITQSDIRQVQLCKGAILSGIITLFNQIGIEEDNIDEVIVAGQFGKYIDPESITGIGIIPMSLKEKIKYIGNSSMTGAKMCLISKEERKIMEDIANNISYIELSTCEGYEKLFTKCLQFGVK